MATKITCNGLIQLVNQARMNGQTQTDIASIAGIHSSALSSILNGGKEPSKREMLALCEVFQKNFEELFEIVFIRREN